MRFDYAPYPYTSQLAWIAHSVFFVLVLSGALYMINQPFDAVVRVMGWLVLISAIGITILAIWESYLKKHGRHREVYTFGEKKEDMR
jgi:hypothetical protein